MELIKLFDYERFRDRVCENIKRIIFTVVNTHIKSSMLRAEIDLMIEESADAIQHVFPQLDRQTALAQVSDIIFNNYEFIHEAWSGRSAIAPGQD